MIRQRSGRSRVSTVLITAGVGVAAAAVVGLGVPAIAAAATSEDKTAAAASAVSDRLSRIKDALSGLVTDGTITQEQADKVASTLEEQVPRHGDGMGPGRGFLGGMFAEIESLAATLKMTTGELRTALLDGKTLAEIAEDQGVATATVIDAIVQAATSRIDEAVEAGRLAEDRAAELKAGLEEKVTAFVNEGGHMRGFGGHHGWGRDGTPAPSSSGTSGTSGT